jgi:hypothetical protein
MFWNFYAKFVFITCSSRWLFKIKPKILVLNTYFLWRNKNGLYFRCGLYFGSDTSKLRSTMSTYEEIFSKLFPYNSIWYLQGSFACGHTVKIQNRLQQKWCLKSWKNWRRKKIFFKLHFDDLRKKIVKTSWGVILSLRVIL